MKCFLAVLNLTNKHPALIFWQAVCYWEIRVSKPRLGKILFSYCEKQKKEDILTDVPQFVEDYCLDVLAGRCQPMKIGGKNETQALPPHPTSPKTKSPRRKKQ